MVNVENKKNQVRTLFDASFLIRTSRSGDSGPGSSKKENEKHKERMVKYLFGKSILNHMIHNYGLGHVVLSNVNVMEALGGRVGHEKSRERVNIDKDTSYREAFKLMLRDPNIFHETRLLHHICKQTNANLIFTDEYSSHHEIESSLVRGIGYEDLSRLIEYDLSEKDASALKEMAFSDFDVYRGESNIRSSILNDFGLSKKESVMDLVRLIDRLSPDCDKSMNGQRLHLELKKYYMFLCYIDAPYKEVKLEYKNLMNDFLQMRLLAQAPSYLLTSDRGLFVRGNALLAAYGIPSSIVYVDFSSLDQIRLSDHPINLTNELREKGRGLVGIYGAKKPSVIQFEPSTLLFHHYYINSNKLGVRAYYENEYRSETNGQHARVSRYFMDVLFVANALHCN